MKNAIEKEDLKKLLSTSITNKYLDPRREPCKWLGAVFLTLLETDTKEAKEALSWALPRMANYVEPGLIDQLFAEWIKEYLHLLAESGNNQNKQNL